MTTQATLAPANEIVSVRTFDYPREKVYSAWTNPDIIKRWWGPNGFTNTFHEFDPQPGGRWRLTMHGPNGADYANESIFVELIEPEKIVIDHVSKPEFLIVATFENVGSKTKIVWRMIFPSAEDCNKVRAVCVPANEENFDRMNAQLVLMPS